MKKSSLLLPRHLFHPARHPTLWALCGALLWCATAAAFATAGPGREQKRKGPAEDFLVFGTVFNQQGLSLPGAEAGIRRAGEKNIRWRGRSDRRGEFAIRVPHGAEYELTVEARGFEKQERKVDARHAQREDFTFRMQPAAGKEEKK